MNVLEKILKEIEERIKRLKEADNMCRVNAERNRNFESMKYFQSLIFATERAESIIGDIIRSHMDEVADDWISVEERLPEEKGDITKDFNLFKESLYLITDGTSVTIAPFDGGYFRCCDDYAPYTDVIAWKPLPEPYKPKKKK